MGGVVVEVRVRAPCKRFAIKDKGTCDRSARGFDGHNAKLHSFFSLRTMRVVTRTSAGLSRVLLDADQRVASRFQGCECYRDFPPTAWPMFFSPYGTKWRLQNPFDYFNCDTGAAATF